MLFDVTKYKESGYTYQVNTIFTETLKDQDISRESRLYKAFDKVVMFISAKAKEHILKKIKVKYPNGISNKVSTKIRDYEALTTQEKNDLCRRLHDLPTPIDWGPKRKFVEITERPNIINCFDDSTIGSEMLNLSFSDFELDFPDTV